jgi:hypothetical protein
MSKDGVSVSVNGRINVRSSGWVRFRFSGKIKERVVVSWGGSLFDAAFGVG